MPGLKKNKASNLYEYCAAELLRYERKLQVQRKKDLENRLKLREEIKRVQMTATMSSAAQTKLGKTQQ